MIDDQSVNKALNEFVTEKTKTVNEEVNGINEINLPLSSDENATFNEAEQMVLKEKINEMIRDVCN